MRSRERVLITVVLAGLTAGALWVDRSIQFFIGRDSSLFLYVAERIQQGAVPYRDVWDHKPPLIYYFGVIGLALGDHGLTGVTVVEFATLLFAALVGFWALYRTIGLLPALSVRSRGSPRSHSSSTAAIGPRSTRGRSSSPRSRSISGSGAPVPRVGDGSRSALPPDSRDC